MGGDIISNKKTFLLLKALELADSQQLSELNRWLQAETFDSTEKVKAVTAIYDEIGIRELTLAKMDEYFAKGFEALAAIQGDEKQKAVLSDFTHYLINREK